MYKRYSKSLVIHEIQVKTTRYHFALRRVENMEELVDCEDIVAFTQERLYCFISAHV